MHKILNRKRSYLLFTLLLSFLIFNCSDDDGPGSGDNPGNELIQRIGDEYQLLSEFGSLDELNVVTNGIFAIWWYPPHEHEQDLTMMFSWLNDLRTDCIENLGMSDPPNPTAGYYYNIYIHHGEDDAFPADWGNGQGTDGNGMPFLTLPDGAHTDKLNVYHEGFHIYQYEANSPGFEYSGDSQWYVEATAQWFMADRNPGEVNAFVEAGAISANPQLALWHSFENHAEGDPTDWLYQVRQYGTHTYLYYLTQVTQVNPAIITDGFYGELSISPQQYLYNQIGAEDIRGFFADWAAATTGGFDYLTPEQWERAQQEVEAVADENNMNPYAITIDGNNLEGTHVPARGLLPRGWSYNVIRITNPPIGANISYALMGNELGSEGAEAHFESRIVSKNSSGQYTYQSLPMDTPITGSMSFTVEEGVEELYLVIAAVPEHFGGNQTYDYKIEFSR